MSRYIIENDQLKLTVSSVGAEMISLVKKDSGVEYLKGLGGDFWQRCAPLLFPINGRLWENTTLVNGKKYEMGTHGLSKLYDFVWDIFCDWYIELVKPRLGDKGSVTNLAAQRTLTYVLSNTLKLLHPFMPFITEEIWRSLPHSGDSIMISDYPEYKREFEFPQAEKEMGILISAIRAIRNRRSEMNVPPSRKAGIIVVSTYGDLFKSGEQFFIRLASASGVEVVGSHNGEGCVRIVTGESEIFIPLADMVDLDAERERLQKELAAAENEIARAEGKLANADFVARAPEKVVGAEKEKLEKYRSVAEKLRESIASLG